MNPADWPWRDAPPLRFDRFMELALHDPERGYYARRIRGVGKGGDFTTTPMLTPALGKAVAAWAKAASTRRASALTASASIWRVSMASWRARDGSIGGKADMRRIIAAAPRIPGPRGAKPPLRCGP